MKSWAIIGLLCMALAVTGCALRNKNKQEPPLPLNAPKNLRQATPEQSAQFLPVVNQYLTLRKDAVVAGDGEVVWKAYPDLKQGTDPKAAINDEANVVARYRGTKLLGGRIEPESYARLMIRVDGDKAVALVNGTELYILPDTGESGGQMQIMLYLERRNGAWTVVRTDETTLAEYKQALR